MSEPKKEAPVHHVYDGIVEEDNHLPNWWLAILFGTIVFGFGYWFVYETTATLPNPGAAYKLEVAELARLHPENVAVTNDGLISLAHDSKVVAEGKLAFAATCVACHLANGQGLVGPNLTDAAWLYGGKPVDIHAAIADGFPEKGMPPWGKTLGATKVRALTAYVLTIKGTNLPGKAPQGVAE